MRKIQVTCPICSRKLTVYEDERGPSGMCPNCGARVEVPLSAFAVLGARKETEELTEDEAAGQEEAPVAVEAPPTEPGIQIQPEGDQPRKGSTPQGATAELATEQPETQKPARQRVSGRDLDLFEPEGGPTKKVLTEYFERGVRPKPKMPLSLILWLPLLGALILLVLYVLLRLL